MTNRAKRWKQLEEREQALFELFLAGHVIRLVYEERWRAIDAEFRALGSVAEWEFAR